MVAAKEEAIPWAKVRLAPYDVAATRVVFSGLRELEQFWSGRHDRRRQHNLHRHGHGIGKRCEQRFHDNYSNASELGL